MMLISCRSLDVVLDEFIVHDADAPTIQRVLTIQAGARAVLSFQRLHEFLYSKKADEAIRKLRIWLNRLPTDSKRAVFLISHSN